MGRLVENDIDSYRTSTTGSIDEISVKIRAIKELLPKLPKGQGETSTTCYSYVTWSDYEKYVKDQRK